MEFRGEIEYQNRRRGPGWWMNAEGDWQPPEEWPEDIAPLPGWIRKADGTWGPSSVEPTTLDGLGVTSEPEQAIPITKQLRSPTAGSRRQRLTAATGVGVVAVLLGVFVAINQAGAGSEPSPPNDADAATEVIFAGRTAADDAAERTRLAGQAPLVAREQLAALPEAGPVPPDVRFDTAVWNAVGVGCLSIDEQVLIERTRTDVGFVDTNDCVVDTGTWLDRYQKQLLNRSTEVEVQPLIPPAVVHDSGGWAWDYQTIEAYLSDIEFRAAWSIVAVDTGYNPRQQSVEEWRPPSQAIWCAYAVDWIAVKHRWSLGVNSQERITLSEMLDSCGTADPETIQTQALAEPVIGLAADG